MKIKPKCILDMDGVISDWVGGIASHHNINLKNIALQPNNYDIAAQFEMTHTDIWKGCGKDFWANLPKTPEADKIINLVCNYFDLDRICIVSVAPLSYGFPLELLGECYAGKLAWINNHYPGLMTHFLLGPSKHFCAGHQSILVDDYEDNCNNFITDGGHAVIVPRIWNKLHVMANSSDKILCFIEFQLLELLKIIQF